MSLFISVFCNMFMLTAVSAVLSFVTLDRLFERRGSTVLYWGYFAVKCAAAAWHDASAYAGTSGASGDTLWIICLGIFAAASFFVLYYTWKAGILKIGITGMAMDTANALIFVVAIMLVNLMGGRTASTDYQMEFTLWSVVTALVYSVMFLIVFGLLWPLLIRLREYEFIHRRFWLALLVLITATSVVSRLTEAEHDVRTSVLFLMVWIALLIAVLAVYVTGRLRRGILSAHMAEERSEFVSMYSTEINSQLKTLQDSRDYLDGLAVRIDELEEQSVRSELEEYIKELKERCDRLRYGLYSDDAETDAVLTVYRERLESRGVRTAYEIGISGRAEGRAGGSVPEVIQALLSRACDLADADHEAAGRTDASADTGEERIVRLRIHEAAGQTIYTLELQGFVTKGRSPFRLRLPAEAGPDAVVKEYSGEGKRKIMIMTQGGGAQ